MGKRFSTVYTIRSDVWRNWLYRNHNSTINLYCDESFSRSHVHQNIHRCLRGYQHFQLPVWRSDSENSRSKEWRTRWLSQFGPSISFMDWNIQMYYNCAWIAFQTMLYDRLLFTDDHFYTTKEDEVNNATRTLGYRNEGEAGWCVKPQGCGANLRLYRFYDPKARGTYFY